ncbi:ribosome biogenesis factor YjgA [Legionella sp. W05-934-2]|uniref:ribosome biogenesis factor YjgA n=1 Tax=Legionella sp. W05-934-2 TaxID=1198649 RepID=UPI0034634E08
MSEDSEWVSKSQRKRDADAVLDLVKNLLELKANELSQLPLSEAALQGLADVKKIHQHGAHKRHMKWLAKQLRQDDLSDIEAAYQAILSSRQGETADFHLAEQWRTRLIEEDNQALAEFISQYKPDDIQQLRQAVRQAKMEYASQQNHGAQRSLFRLIKAMMQ